MNWVVGINLRQVSPRKKNVTAISGEIWLRNIGGNYPPLSGLKDASPPRRPGGGGPDYETGMDAESGEGDISPVQNFGRDVPPENFA